MKPLWLSAAAFLAACFLLPSPAPALDAEGLSTVVAYNADSRDSRELARLFAKTHDVPAANLCAVKVPKNAWTMSEAEFARLRDDIDVFFAANRLAGRIRFLVLSCDIPTRAGRDNSTTAALFYGLHPRTSGVQGCDMAPGSANPYFSAERTYRPEAGWVEGNKPLVFSLAVPSPAEGKALLSRARLPAPEKAVVCLHGSADGARNVRHPRYPAVERLWKLCGPGRFPSLSLSVAPSNYPAVSDPVAGYTIGRVAPPSNFLANATFAGTAIAEHLTSCGAIFPDACNGQDTLWKWFEAGAGASYGTVAEPCNFTAKFPDPMLYFWYARGFTAGEALWMSVKNPYQGLMAGDPLMRPYARTPEIEVLRPEPGATFRKGDSFRLRLRRAEGEAAPVHVAMYVDGRFHAVVAKPVAPTLNELVVTIGEDEFRYAVAPGEMTGEAVAGIAWAIQRNSRGKYKAKAFSDRLEVTARAAAADPPVPFAARVEQGRGEGLYMEARALSSSLVETAPGVREACALFSLGSVGEFEISYPADLSSVERGKHVASFVVRDGSALEAAGRCDWPIRVP